MADAAAQVIPAALPNAGARPAPPITAFAAKRRSPAELAIDLRLIADPVHHRCLDRIDRPNLRQQSHAAHCSAKITRALGRVSKERRG